MKKYKQRIFETSCKRCGRKIHVNESAFSHPLGRICERCITPNEKQQIMDFQVARMIRLHKRNPMDEENLNMEPYDDSFEKRFPHIRTFFEQATSWADIIKLKRQANKKERNDEPGWKSGPIDYFFKRIKDERGYFTVHTRTAAEYRTDQILRTRIPGQRAVPRKWHTNPINRKPRYYWNVWGIDLSNNKRKLMGGVVASEKIVAERIAKTQFAEEFRRRYRFLKVLSDKKEIVVESYGRKNPLTKKEYDYATRIYEKTLLEAQKFRKQGYEELAKRKEAKTEGIRSIATIFGPPSLVRPKHRKNPNILGFQIGKPKGLYESFHGNPPKTRKLKIGVPEPGEKIISIGKLINLEYLPYGSSKYKKTQFTHKLGDDGTKILPNKPILAVSEDGKQLYIINDKSKYKFGENGIVG